MNAGSGIDRAFPDRLIYHNSEIHDRMTAAYTAKSRGNFKSAAFSVCFFGCCENVIHAHKALSYIGDCARNSEGGVFLTARNSRFFVISVYAFALGGTADADLVGLALI